MTTKIPAGINGETKVIGVFGWPLTYTLSPVFQNAGLAAKGFNAAYIPFPIEEASEFVRLFRSLAASPAFLGGNVTNPHKLAALRLADSLTPQARAVGAVNTLFRRGQKWVGHNTDAQGFLAALKAKAVSPKGKKVLVLGSGGATRAILFACREAGARELHIACRRIEYGKALAKRFQGKGNAIQVSEISPGALSAQMEWADLIVNCVPGVAFASQAARALAACSSPKTVFDISYAGSNPLLAQAKKKGYRTVGGLGMLLEQGCLSFAIWTKKKAPKAIMAQELKLGSG